MSLQNWISTQHIFWLLGCLLHCKLTCLHRPYLHRSCKLIFIPALFLQCDQLDLCFKILRSSFSQTFTIFPSFLSPSCCLAALYLFKILFTNFLTLQFPSCVVCFAGVSHVTTKVIQLKHKMLFKWSMHRTKINHITWDCNVKQSIVKVKILYHSVWGHCQSLRISPVLFSTSPISWIVPSKHEFHKLKRVFQFSVFSHAFPFSWNMLLLTPIFLYTSRLVHLISPAASLFLVFSLYLVSPLWQLWHLNACIHLNIYISLPILNTDGMSGYILVDFSGFLFHSSAKILSVSWT